MPRDQHHMILREADYVELTDGPIAPSEPLTFQCLSGVVEIRGTVDGTPPASSQRGRRYDTPYGEPRTTLQELFARGDCTRLWARPMLFQSEIYIDHA